MILNTNQPSLYLGLFIIYLIMPVSIYLSLFMSIYPPQYVYMYLFMSACLFK